MDIIVDNLAVRYTDGGLKTALAVVLLHGWGQTGSTFDALAREFAGEYRIITFDFPGFGRSELPRKAWGVHDYAEFLAHFFLKIGVEPYAVIGHSFGGRVAIKAAGEGLVTPEKLVLIASAGVLHPLSGSKKLLGVLPRVGGVLIKAPLLGSLFVPLWRRFAARLSSEDDRNAGPLRGTFRKVIAEDLREDAKQVRIPTLIVWGEDDEETPLSDGRLLKDCIGGSRLEVIPGAGHFVYQEKTDIVVVLLKQFL